MPGTPPPPPPLHYTDVTDALTNPQLAYFR
jgi:hypothetical protein